MRYARRRFRLVVLSLALLATTIGRAPALAATGKTEEGGSIIAARLAEMLSTVWARIVVSFEAEADFTAPPPPPPGGGSELGHGLDPNG